MRARMRSMLMLVTVLLGGALVGALGAGAVHGGRLRRLDAARQPDGLVRTLQDVLQVPDGARWERIRPFVEEADRRNRRAVDEARASLHASMDSLQRAIEPMLEPDEQARLMRLIDRPQEGPPPGLPGDRPPREPGGPPSTSTPDRRTPA